MQRTLRTQHADVSKNFYGLVSLTKTLYIPFDLTKSCCCHEQEPLRGLALYWNISRQYSNTDQESVLLFREQDG